MQDRSFSIVTRPQAGHFRFLILAQAGNFLFFITFRLALGSYWKGTGVLSGWGMKLNTHFHVVPRWRMGGAIPLLPVYYFMALTGTTLPSYTANEQLFSAYKVLWMSSVILHVRESRKLEKLWPRSLVHAESLQNCYLFNMIACNVQETDNVGPTSYRK